MEIGDLVRCTWQPRVTRIEHTSNFRVRAVPMEYQIKGEVGLIVDVEQGCRFSVFFPKFSYTHVLASPTLEVINESR